MQKTVNSIAIPLGGHTLPPLRYGYNALEPVIDAETLQIHHEKHHKKYVDELNKAELALAAIRHAEDYSHLNCVKCLEEAIAFNGSGHILHSVYWTIMTAPDTGGNPGTNTKSFIDWYFGSVNAFKAQFAAAAKTVEGSGWGILAYNPAFGRLEILQSEKHQNLTQWGAIPILVCDVWEHAYYLKYKNGRDSYVDAWWRLVDWNEVEHRLVLAARGYLPLA